MFFFVFVLLSAGDKIKICNSKSVIHHNKLKLVNPSYKERIYLENKRENKRSFEKNKGQKIIVNKQCNKKRVEILKKQLKYFLHSFYF